MKLDNLASQLKQEFPALAAAPTTEGIFKALKAGKWRGSEPVKGALECLFKLEHVEQFNFGPLSLDTIHEAQAEALDFVEHECISLPYPECVFRCSVQFDNRTVGFHIFSIQRDSSGTEKRIVSLGTIHSPDHVLTFRSDNMMKVLHRGDKQGIAVSIPNNELDHWEPMLGEINGPLLESSVGIVGEASTIMMGLIMILNTKGVLKERTAPAAKPNKVRAARGLPLLPYTTRVYTSVYNRAVEKGAQGTHASPRPHRRRAHIRHIAKTERHEAYMVPIDAMLINWDGKPLQARKEYVVK